jgi:hypothetical protein
MTGKNGSSAVEESEEREQDGSSVDLGFELLGWRGASLAGTVLVSVFLLAQMTHNALATVLGSALVTGIALDLVLRPTRVLLGPEGLVRRGLRTSRMRYADIVEVVHGELLVIHGARTTWSFSGAPSAELARLLEARLLVFRAHEQAPSAPLARDERDDETWARELRDLALGERHGYRQATVSPEVLLRIAENPTSRDQERIAALVALSPSAVRGSDSLVRARIAALAPETAAPDLREAVEAWLDEDDATLERMLHQAPADR